MAAILSAGIVRVPARPPADGSAGDRTAPRLGPGWGPVRWAGRHRTDGPARCVVRIEPLASADPEEIVAAVAPTVQHHLAGPLDG